MQGPVSGWVLEMMNRMDPEKINFDLVAAVVKHIHTKVDPPKKASRQEQTNSKRLADDGSEYTYDEFLNYYGREDGARRWQKGAPQDSQQEKGPGAMLI